MRTKDFRRKLSEYFNLYRQVKLKQKLLFFVMSLLIVALLGSRFSALLGENKHFRSDSIEIEAKGFKVEDYERVVSFKIENHSKHILDLGLEGKFFDLYALSSNKDSRLIARGFVIVRVKVISPTPLKDETLIVTAVLNVHEAEKILSFGQRVSLSLSLASNKERPGKKESPFERDDIEIIGLDPEDDKIL